MSKKFGVSFDGLQDMAKLLDAHEGRLEKTVERALVETQEYVATKVKPEIKRHHRTGRTEASIMEDGKVDWEGLTVKIGVGFDINNGGLASIFLMHGTQLHGTPRVKPDRALHDAVFGATTTRNVRKIQKEVFEKEMGL